MEILIVGLGVLLVGLTWLLYRLIVTLGQRP